MGQTKLDDRAITPQPLKPVKHPLFFVEHVRDNIAEVEEDPSTQFPSFTPECLSTDQVSLVFDFVSDRLDVSFVASRRDDEDVDNAEGFRNVEGKHVLALFGIGGQGDDSGELDGFVLCCHVSQRMSVK